MPTENKTAEEIISEYLPSLDKASASIFATVLELYAAPLLAEIERLKAEKWIKVEDELPKIKCVMVAYKFGVTQSDFVNKEFCMPFNWSIKIPEVTHWQPLPEPPTKPTLEQEFIRSGMVSNHEL